MLDHEAAVEPRVREREVVTGNERAV